MKRSLAVLAAVAIVAAAAPCVARSQEPGRQGRSVTVSQSFAPDFLDPALGYTLNSWEPLWLVYTPLLTYARAEGEAGAQLIPGLASGLPTVSADGLTYALTLRPGLRYSDGRPVVASDFEHALKRVLDLESGGAAFFRQIVGAREYERANRPQGDISGIETNDATGQITIRLTRPNGTLPYVLALPFAGLVPGDTPFRNLTRSPPPGVGPYRLASTSRRAFVLERNALFGVPGIPSGNVDRITTRIVRSAAKQARSVIDGKLDAMQDPPPRSFRRRIARRHTDQYEVHVTASTYYFFMNSRVAPFDKLKVRQAVNYAVDKRALARQFWPALAPGCSFLPPGVPGYDANLDGAGCPWGAPTRRPNLRRARALIRQAGAVGARVTVWGNTDQPGPRLMRAYTRMLNAIGLRARTRLVSGSVYFQTVGSRRTRPQTGFANWFADIIHPANFFHLVDGMTIRRRANQNYGNVDDPSLNQQIAALTAQPTLAAGPWQALNRQLVERGDLVPYGHAQQTTFMSERMDIGPCSRFHPLFGNDYSSFCLK